MKVGILSKPLELCFVLLLLLLCHELFHPDQDQTCSVQTRSNMFRNKMKMSQVIPILALNAPSVKIHLHLLQHSNISQHSDPHEIYMKLFNNNPTDNLEVALLLEQAIKKREDP